MRKGAFRARDRWIGERLGKDTYDVFVGDVVGRTEMDKGTGLSSTGGVPSRQYLGVTRFQNMSFDVVEIILDGDRPGQDSGYVITGCVGLVLLRRSNENIVLVLKVKFDPIQCLGNVEGFVSQERKQEGPRSDVRVGIGCAGGGSRASASSSSSMVGLGIYTITGPVRRQG